MGVHSFMEEYRERTTLDALNRRQRVWRRSVRFELRPHHSWVTLGRIEAIRPGHGYGSEALDWLCALADRHQVRLQGIIEPFGPIANLTTGHLRDWYERRGFEVTNEYYIDREATVDRIAKLQVLSHSEKGGRLHG